jgi:AcrR family transcriptional regulator
MTTADTSPALTAAEMDEYRRRLLDGMAAAIVEKGYAETTIADVVRHARVSKRTFYQYFADKQACLLACYAISHDRVIRAIEARQPSAAHLGWEVRLVLGLRDFLNAGESQLTLMSTLMIEILAAGREGLRARREIYQRFTDLLLKLAEQERELHGKVRKRLSPNLATAIVSGIHEIMLSAYEDERSHNVTDLMASLSTFVSSLFSELDAQHTPAPG